MNLSKYKSLGVINWTPNSFSDHGASLNPTFFDSQLRSFLEDPTVIIDIGFESTAPMNTAITEALEIERFQEFLQASKNYSFADKFVSFDTYKVRNFLFMAREFQKIHPQVNLIFNDVSGVLDDELKAAILPLKDKNFFYIFTFSHIPERSEVLRHMDFIKPEIDIINSASKAFKEAFDWFKTIGMESQLILDPGFGFSKTYQQNWQLIDRFSDLEILSNLDNPWLIGLSKKSFLKKALELTENSQPQLNLEELHKKCIKNILNSSDKKILFRVHDPSIMKSS